MSYHMANRADIIEEPERWKSALQFCFLAFLIFLSFVLGKLVHKFKIFFLTESGVTAFLGLFVGFINYLTGGLLSFGDKNSLKFNSFIFDWFVLPAIIFESGYSLRKKGLFQNLPTIVLFAVFGTLFSSIMIGSIIYFLASILKFKSLDPSSPIESLIFGSLISAIDPVATIAIMGDSMKLSSSLNIPKIFNLVFGESVINDAVSIVLFRVFIRYMGTPFTFVHIFEMVGLFIYVSCGSVLIGLVVGFSSSLIFKFLTFKENNSSETILLTCCAFVSYFLAEAINLSGIMSLFVCSIIMGRYAWYNLSEYSRLSTPSFFKALANFADTYVFLYLGLAAFTFGNVFEWSLGFIGVSILLCIISRLHIFPLSFISNLLWQHEMINWREMVFLWMSGLRGAIAFTLSLHTVQENSPNSKEIVSTTLVIVLFSVWVFGGLSYPLLWILGLDDQKNVKKGTRFRRAFIETVNFFKNKKKIIKNQNRNLDIEVNDNQNNVNDKKNSDAELELNEEEMLEREKEIKIEEKIMKEIQKNKKQKNKSYNENNPSAIVLINKTKHKEEQIVYLKTLKAILKKVGIDFDPLTFLEKRIVGPILKKRSDETSAVLREMLISGAVQKTMRFVQVDLTSGMYEDLKEAATTKVPRYSVMDIIKGENHTSKQNNKNVENENENENEIELKEKELNSNNFEKQNIDDNNNENIDNNDNDKNENIIINNDFKEKETKETIIDDENEEVELEEEEVFIEIENNEDFKSQNVTGRRRTQTKENTFQGADKIEIPDFPIE